MKNRVIKSLTLLSALSLSLCFLSSCQGINFIDINTNIYSPVDISVINEVSTKDFSYSYDESMLSIIDGKLYGIKEGTSEVKVLKNNNQIGAFTASVSARTFVNHYQSVSSQEKWFDEIDIPQVDNATSEVPFGVDISSIKQIYDCGGAFYNFDGKETSVFKLLKENYVNYVRLRLWLDPYNNIDDGSGNISKVSYGGGSCDLSNIFFIAKEAYKEGMKIYLDFHYSDFWADPSHQIIPKAWADIKSSDEMASTIKQYTKETIKYFVDNGVKISLVQIGNEITGGMLFNAPGGTNSELNGNNGPYYTTKSTKASSSISGSNETNLKKYLSAGIEAINEVDDSILKMIHLAKGFSATEYIISWFNRFKSLDYDVIGLSAYSYWHFASIDVLKNSLVSISKAFPNKLITLAETSYGFTTLSASYASNIFTSKEKFLDYDISPYGQAKLLRDMYDVMINSITNGYGIFYWEPAWTIVQGAGWAETSSLASWANQGFFSYDGKALGSLKVYRKILGL